MSQSPSPPHPSCTIPSASLPSTIDVVESDISASTSSKNSNTHLTTSLSKTELTVDVLTIEPTINDLVPTIIPSSISHQFYIRDIKFLHRMLHCNNSIVNALGMHHIMLTQLLDINCHFLDLNLVTIYMI